MIIILINFTEQEKLEMDAIESKYEKEFRELEAITERLNPTPNTDDLFIGLDANNGEWETALDKENEIMNKWEDSGSEEWQTERKKWRLINERLNEERTLLAKRAEERQFAELGGSINNILKNAKEQLVQVIYSLVQFVNPNNDIDFIMSEKEVRIRLKNALRLHIEALKTNKKLYREFENYMDDTIKHISYTTQCITEEETAIIVNQTFFPTCITTPKDKVSNYLFVGEIGATDDLSTERRGSKKELTVKASIDYDDLKGVTINGNKELAPYDREVHDSIISLILCGNNPISPIMILRAMTGNPGAKLNPEQEKAIDESVQKLFFSKLRIDASGEASAYKMEKVIYEGYLVAGEKVTVKYKGNEPETWYNVLRPPVLYEYAKSKKQIAQMDINLLYTPVNKTDDMIVIQGYLYRRIQTMQRNPNQSNNILYQSIFKYAGLEDITRQKKSRLTERIKTILNDWVSKDFIKGFTENTKGKATYSISIIY